MTTYTYLQFIDLVDKLVAEGRTTGLVQTEDYIGYTILNRKRMERLHKTVELTDELVQLLKGISEKQTWLLITEAWCGDSAQNLPVLYQMACENSEYIDMKIVLRDDHPTLMDRYLTNGSRSIPKLIIRNAANEDIVVWGPRPQLAQEIFLAWKADPNGSTWADFELQLHTWYAHNKTMALQHEFIQIFKSIY